jgi:hypothetical protein
LCTPPWLVLTSKIVRNNADKYNGRVANNSNNNYN